MQVFIAGATGVLGRRVVDSLVADGYEVVGLSRSQQNTDWLSSHGALPRRGDLFNQEQISEITADCDAILHLATAIPTGARPRKRDWAMNDLIRREGTRALVGAALHNNCQLYVQQSITRIYGDHGAEWVDESTPLPEKQLDVIQSAVDMEQIVQDAAAHGLPATILRLGIFYSHDSAHTQAMFQLMPRRSYPIVGAGGGYWSQLHVDDAAAAVCQVVKQPGACIGQTFNVCDNLPIQYGNLMAFVAETLNAPQPRRIPVWLARLLLGNLTVGPLLASTRCRNECFKNQTGWQPKYPTYREGIPAEVEKWRRQK
ncbi:MAG TPA: NAD(P)-dependent oxidoreductase [Anaerolineae bacterium]